jgi:CheY-like chemotaxis protein
MRELKLSDEALAKLLEDLDVQDVAAARRCPTGVQHYAYRVPALRVDFNPSPEVPASVKAPTRRLWERGVTLLTGHLVPPQSVCRVHLATLRGSFRTVGGAVEKCRYVPGTTGVHEVFIRFDVLVDPPSFTLTAHHPRILAADDSRVTQKLYERLLSGMRVELVCVASGTEAVERARSEDFDLLLMESEMPGTDGRPVIRQLRDAGYVRPIIAVSAQAEPADGERIRAEGCDDVLVKPLSLETLAAVIQRHRSKPLVSALADDPEMTERIDRFVAGLPHVVRALEAAFGERQTAALQRASARIQGKATDIGFGLLSDAAAVVRSAIRRGQARDAIRAQLAALVRLCLSARPITGRAPEAECGASAPAVSEADGAS